MICSSCSTTRSVLPLSRKLCITRTSRPTSRGCKPMLGSSITNSVLTSDAPRHVVRFTRCASPPLKVREILEALTVTELYHPRLGGHGPPQQFCNLALRVDIGHRCSEGR